MHKRQFLGTAAAAGLAPLAPLVAAAPSGTRGPALLTITGAIGRGNRGSFDPVLDQMMHKQGVTFSRAWTFDEAALAALPTVTIRPTLDYDDRPHLLRGPPLLDVLAHAGARVGEGTVLVLRAVDGYNVELAARDAAAWRFIVATHIDGGRMPLGGFGPAWAVYDADRVPAMAALPPAQRFQKCPWALYHIDVRS